jgi:hypothetical protein
MVRVSAVSVLARGSVCRPRSRFSGLTCTRPRVLPRKIDGALEGQPPKVYSLIGCISYHIILLDVVVTRYCVLSGVIYSYMPTYDIRVLVLISSYVEVVSVVVVELCLCRSLGGGSVSMQVAAHLSRGLQV